jgi:hypothetical protein
MRSLSTSEDCAHDLFIRIIIVRTIKEIKVNNGIRVVVHHFSRPGDEMMQVVRLKWWD